MLAVLIDVFWREPQAALAAEIRLQEARFGLDPVARRRLQWAESPGPIIAERATRSLLFPAQDPRRLLATLARETSQVADDGDDSEA